MSQITSRFDDALIYAANLHRDQIRKGAGIPYLSHLLSVAALVLEDGGDEDQAVAALLHDPIEDQPRDRLTRQEIEQRFGARVLAIVEACTDADSTPKPPWKERKQRYIAHIKEQTPATRRVSLADKLHNARSILADLRRHGPLVWDRFNAGRDGTLWYYRARDRMLLKPAEPTAGIGHRFASTGADYQPSASAGFTF